ncbi:MAG: hypothetical protein ACLQDY_18830 [Streptosporangiaceae bacterium]
MLTPLTALIGSRRLSELTAQDVHDALVSLAATRSTRTVRDTRAAARTDRLERAPAAQPLNLAVETRSVVALSGPQ